MRTSSFILPILFICLSTLVATHSDGFKDEITCDVCVIGVGLAETLLVSNKTEQIVKDALLFYCVDAKIEDKTVCQGLINEFAPTVFPILQHQGLGARKICDLAGYCTPSTSQLAPIPPPEHVPRGKFTPAAAGGYILQISDVHWDDLYTIGANPNCPDPLCCRANDGNGTSKAQKWGDYNCDLSIDMFTAFLSEISSLDPPPTFLVWTGDNPPHDVWDETAEGQLNRLKIVSQMIYQAFPKTPVFPVLGNHDTFPVDQFSRAPVDAAHYDNFDWLINGLTSFWGQWISQESINNFVSGGYYTELAQTGLRIIALNSQMGDPLNFYLYLQDEQYNVQLKWFADTMAAAAQNGEKVILLGHIPIVQSAPAELSPWATDYITLVNSYSDIIVGQFFGHTHKDQFQMVKNSTNDAIGVVYIAPSVTTFGGINPSYRMYQYDQNFELVDYDQYICNLTAANLQGKPTWYLEYSAKSEYGMSDLSPASWDKLVSQLQSSDSVWNTWYTNYYTNVDHGNCDSNCRTHVLCEVASTTSEQCAACRAQAHLML